MILLHRLNPMAKIDEEKEDAAYLELLSNPERRRESLDAIRKLLASQNAGMTRAGVIGSFFAFTYFVAEIPHRLGVSEWEVLPKMRAVLLAFAGIFFLKALIHIFLSAPARTDKKLLLMCEYLETKNR